MTDTREIEPADPAARRQALLWLTAAVAVGLPLVWLADRGRATWAAWLGGHAELLRDHPWIAGLAALVAVAPLVGFAAWIRRLGRRVAAAERFPPPGSRPVRPTPVLVGTAAVARGRVLQRLAWLLGMPCLAVPILATRIAAALLG